MRKKARIILCAFSAALTVALAFFVWFMLDAGNSESRVMLGRCLFIVAGVTIITQVIYSFKGQIFEHDGRLAAREILFSIICFQCIMQFGFGFAMYAANQIALQNSSLDGAYEYFTELQRLAPENDAAAFRGLDIERNMPEYVESVVIAEGRAGDPNRHFRFPIDGGTLLMQKSQAYFAARLRQFALDMLMSLVISILLMIEIVYLMTKYLDNMISRERITAPGYLRQLAFLFYFAGFLGSSFVPVLARDLYGDSPNANFIAGLPYSVEALFNCVAILMAAPVFRKFGWKPPYAAGAAVFALGLALSSAASDVYFFIFARAIAGMGYGLCWMTLRNIATVGDNRTEAFGSLTAGTYGGVMSAVAFGAILADKIGYSAVLFLSAILCVALLAFPMMIGNEKPVTAPAQSTAGVKIGLVPRDIAAFGVFILLIVIPTVVSDAFCDYFAPLYVNDLGMSTAYIGRVSLVYNLCIVYIGTTIMMKLVTRLFRSELMWNISHMVLVSCALFSIAYIGGITAVMIAAMILGTADGFGFSAQNTYILNTNVSRRVGTVRMLMYISLFKKFAAMFAPAAFGIFLGIRGGMALMAAIFAICAAVCFVTITLLFTRSALIE